MAKLMQVALGLVALVSVCSGLENGLARLPPMGWLSWERFRCETDCKTYPDSCLSEKLLMDMADKIVELGLKDLGYEYVAIDDCWPAKTRDPETGKLMPDPDRFPSGMKALADYMHKLGLKLGIYEDFGTTTCAGYPGSEFYLELDATTFAEWGVDMVKFDGCNSDPKDNPYGYPIMEFFLNKTGRPIMYACEWPLHEKGKHDYAGIKKYCNMWRNFDDVTDSWDSIKSIVRFFGNNQQDFSAFSGPGSWANPDELVVGDFGLSYYQQRAQMGMWAMFSAPLFMSVDLRSIHPKALAILTNKDVLAINQDPLGIMATRLYAIPNALSVWTKPLHGDNTAIAFFSEYDQGRPTPLNITLGDIGLTSKNGYNVTEVFDGKPFGMYKPSSSFYVLVDPTSVLLLKAEPL